MNGTGFFGLIEFPNKKMIRALFTCYHNLVSENSKEKMILDLFIKIKNMI